MKQLFLTLAVALLPWAAAADPEHCKALADASPADLFKIARAPTQDLETEHPGLGYGVSYRDETLSLSVYFFDGGQAALNEQVERGYFDGAIGDMQTLAKRDGYSYGDFRAFDTRQAGEFVSFIAEATDSRDLFQVAAMGRSGDCLVKLRFTTPLDHEAGREVFWALATSLGLSRE